MVVDSVDQGLKGFSKETAEGTELNNCGQKDKGKHDERAGK